MSTEFSPVELASQLSRPNGESGKEVADLMHETNISMTMSAFKALKVTPNQNLVELGHGSAKHLEAIFNIVPTLNYKGLEVSDLMHAESKENNKKFIDNKQSSFHLYDGLSLPLDDNSVDNIMTVNTLYFWENPQDLLKECLRVLKPGAKLSVTFATKRFMQQLPFAEHGFTLYNPNDFIDLANSVEFSSKEVKLDIETISTKMGGEVDREYATIICTK